MITVSVTVITGRGLVRDNNEDRIGVFGWCAPVEMPAPVTLSLAVGRPAVVVVADGLGGHPAGEVASAMAVELCGADPGQLTGATALTARIQSIHSGILAAGAVRPEHTGMATTLTAAVVSPDSVRVVSVGDSRAYYVEPGFVEQLTEDDVDPNGSGALSQVLGGREGSTVDAEIVMTQPRAGLRLLLCTDGLHAHTDPAELRRLLDTPDAVESVAALHRAAYEAGAPDNVSLCLLDVTTSEE